MNSSNNSGIGDEQEKHAQFYEDIGSLIAKIEENREEKEERRCETLFKMYKDFLLLLPNEELRKRIYLSEQILRFAVVCYFDSIYRFKIYARTARADRHKQAAYLYKWLNKTKPIQILPNPAKPITGLNFVNAIYATHVALTVLFNEDSPQLIQRINGKVYQNLIYHALYRNISGRAMAAYLCAIEQSCRSSAAKEC